MSTCIKYVVTNTSQTSPIVVSWVDCSGQSKFQSIRKGKSKTIWAINNTLTSTFTKFARIFKSCTCTNTMISNVSNTNTFIEFINCEKRNQRLFLLPGAETRVCLCIECLSKTGVPNKNFTFEPLQECVDEIPVTPTPTSTPVLTPSITPTNTVTPSITPTNSVTPSITPTNSVTPSITPTNSVTPSITPTNTVTPSITPTNTVTPSITPTNTVTPSNTPIVTPSITPSNTVTPSITPTNTVTPSITPSVTPTITSSITPTMTPTKTVTPSITPSVTPTLTPTLTPSTSPLPIFETEYQNILNFATLQGYTTPSVQQKIAQNDLVKDLKINNIWSSLDRLFIYLNGIPNGFQFAGIEWKNPSTTTELLTVDSPTYSSVSGYTSNGSTSYLNTRFNALSGGTAFTQTSNSISVGYDNLIYGGTSGGTVYGARISSTSSTQMSLIPKSGVWRHFGDNVTFPDLPTTTLLQVARLQVNLSGQTATQYQNANLIRTVTNVTGATPNYNIFNGAINNDNTAQFNGRNTIKYFAVGAPYDAVIFDSIIKKYLSSFSDYEAEYIDVLNFALSSGYAIPDSNTQIIQNQLVRDLKENGVWNSLDRLFVYVSNVPNGFQFAGINWKNPTSSTSVALINSPFYNSALGFANNGTNGYVNTLFNPTVDGVNFKVSGNTICVGYDNTTITPLSGGTVYGSRSGSGSGDQMILTPNSGIWRHSGNDSTFPNLSTNTLSLIGRLQVIMTGGTVTQYQNGVLVRQVNSVVPSIPNFRFYNCAINDNNNPQFNGQSYVKYFAVGAPFDASTFDTIMNTYLTSMSTYEPEYLEVLNFAAKSSTPIPTGNTLTKQNQIVKDLKTNNIWNSLDRFYVYTNNASIGYEFARINWKNPSVSTRTTNNNIQYSSEYGIRNENGNPGYVNTNFNPSTMGTAYTFTTNTICVGYDNTFGSASGGTVYGAWENSTSINQVALTPISGIWRHYGDATTFPTLSAGTLSQAARVQVTLKNGTISQYQNGSLIRSVSPGVVGQPPNLNLYNCAINNNGTPEFNGINYVKYFAVGGDIDANNFDTIMSTYYS